MSQESIDHFLPTSLILASYKIYGFVTSSGVIGCLLADVIIYLQMFYTINSGAYNLQAEITTSVREGTKSNPSIKQSTKR